MKPGVKLAITGGHPTPALPIIALARREGWKVYWFGQQQALAGTSIGTLETKIIPKLGIPFFSIQAVKFHRKSRLTSFLSSWKMLVGFVQSIALLVFVKPDVLLSFGSYISVPVAAAAWLLRIPIVLHEQTAASGLANRVVARLSTKVAVAFAQSRPLFPVNKVVLTGNPLRESIWKVAEKRYKSRQGRSRVPSGTRRGPPSAARLKYKMPTIYVTGGSRGSSIINKTVAQVLPELLANFRIYHQTGELDFERMVNLKDALPAKLKKNYHVWAYLTARQIDNIFFKASFCISRAGANTVQELAAIGLPAIFIPIPWAGSDEQTKNAEILVEAGTAVLLSQDKLTPESLLSAVGSMLRQLPKYEKAVPIGQKIVSRDSSLRLFKLVESVI